MKVVCISASNTYHMGTNSTSTRVCTMIGRMINEKKPGAEIEIIPLMNRKINFCMLCGDCTNDGQCLYDKDFNSIYSALGAADICFFVVPHYSPLPSKLMALFEKINEIIYANWLKIPQYESPFLNKRAAVIGHGGSGESEERLRYYHDSLIAPVANTLSSFGFSVVGLNETFPLGAPFALKDDSCIQPKEGVAFPDIIQDWELIEKRIHPLIEKAIKP